MTPQDFLQFVFADKTDDEIVCVCKGSYMNADDEAKNRLAFWNLDPTAEAFTGWVARPHRAKQAWYMCVSTVDGTLNEKGTALRRGYEQLKRAHCLVLDDIGTKASEPPVPPAWKIETSEGNFQWGYLIEPTDNFKRYEALLQWAHEQGWGDKGAGGAYRVVRIPGSCNLKAGKNKFIAQVEMGDDAVWSLEELGKALGISDEQWAELQQGTSSNRRERARAGGAAIEQAPIEDELLNWLRDNARVIEDRGDKVDIICPWADQHTDGNNVATYWPFGRGERPEWRGFKCLHEHCHGRRYGDLQEWVVENGGPFAPWRDALALIQRRFTYVAQGQLVVDMIQRPIGGVWKWELNDWSNAHYTRVETPGREEAVLLRTAFLESDRTTKAVAISYNPCTDDGLYEEAGQLYVNGYIPPRWQETDELPATFLEHLEYLVPDRGQRELYLNWLALKVQQPGSRSYCMVMVSAGYGVGRTIHAELLERMWKGQVKAATIGQLIGKGTTADATYNDWGTECILTITQEARDNSDPADFYRGYEGFKKVISPGGSDERIRVNPKYGKTRYDRLWFNALILSNHADALVIPADDRRICVITNPTERREGAYYERIKAGFDDAEAARLWWYLKRRDVAGFDHIYPPMTPGKAAMIEQTVSPVDEVMAYVIEHLEGDIVTRKMLEARVRTAARETGNDKVEQSPGGVARRIWKSLGSLRPSDKNGARYRIDTMQDEVRAVRNKERWLAADDARDRDAIVGELKRNHADIVALPKTT